VFIDPASTEFVHEEFLPGLLDMTDDEYPAVNLIAGIPSRPKGYKFTWAAKRGRRPSARPGYDRAPLPRRVALGSQRFSESMAFTYNVMGVSGQVDAYDDRSDGAFMPAMMEEAEECVLGLRVIEEQMILALRRGSFGRVKNNTTITGAAAGVNVTLDDINSNFEQDFANAVGLEFKTVNNPDEGASRDTDRGTVVCTANPVNGSVKNEQVIKLRRVGSTDVGAKSGDFLMYNYKDGVGSQAIHTLFELIGTGPLHGVDPADFPLWRSVDRTSSSLAINSRMLDGIFVQIQRNRGVRKLDMLPMLLLCEPEFAQKINQLADSTSTGNGAGSTASVNFVSGQTDATGVRTFRLNFGQQTVETLPLNKMPRDYGMLIDRSKLAQVGGDSLRMVGAGQGSQVWKPELSTAGSGDSVDYLDAFVAHIRLDRQLYVTQRNCMAKFKHAAISL